MNTPTHEAEPSTPRAHSTTTTTQTLASLSPFVRGVMATAVLVGAVAVVPSESSARRAPAPGWMLSPGQSLGPVFLGMSRAEVQRLAPLIRPAGAQSGPDVWVSRAWYFVFDAQGLRTARRPLALSPGVVVNGRRVTPASTLPMIAAMRIPGCSPVQRRVGGAVITCRGRQGYAHFTVTSVSNGRVEVDISRDR